MLSAAQPTDPEIDLSPTKPALQPKNNRDEFRNSEKSEMQEEAEIQLPVEEEEEEEEERHLQDFADQAMLEALLQPPQPQPQPPHTRAFETANLPLFHTDTAAATALDTGEGQGVFGDDYEDDLGVLSDVDEAEGTREEEEEWMETSRKRSQSFNDQQQQQISSSLASLSASSGLHKADLLQEPSSSSSSSSATLLDEIATSLFTPGFSDKMTTIMNATFMALFIVLVALAVLTGGNIHAIALLGIALALFAAVNW